MTKSTNEFSNANRHTCADVSTIHAIGNSPARIMTVEKRQNCSQL